VASKAIPPANAMILGHIRTSTTSRHINPHWEEMLEAVEELGRLCHLYATRCNDRKEGDLAKIKLTGWLRKIPELISFLFNRGSWVRFPPPLQEKTSLIERLWGFLLGFF